MMDLKTILSAHAEKYPLMEPTDAVKLLYQNEFGGGHLIRNETACLEFLRQEYRSISQETAISLTEPIGNGMVRVNLAALDHHGLSLEALGLVFLRSAATSHGSLESFQEKLALLETCTAAGNLPFSPEALEDYLSSYKKAGFPMVSHSQTYRNAYHPAYRVVCSSILSDVIQQIP